MKSILLFFAVFAGANSLRAATYFVNVDTSSLALGATGFLDFQFNGSGNPTPAGTARVTEFFGTDFSVDPLLATTFGAVSGDLTPGPLYLANTDPFNDYFVPFAITGELSGFSFLLRLSGDILSPPVGNLNGTDFGLLIFGADGSTPLLTPDGQLVRISVNEVGSVSAQGFGPGSATYIPEPGTAALFVAAGLAMAARALSRR